MVKPHFPMESQPNDMNIHLANLCLPTTPTPMPTSAMANMLLDNDNNSGTTKIKKSFSPW